MKLLDKKDLYSMFVYMWPGSKAWELGNEEIDSNTVKTQHIDGNQSVSLSDQVIL